MINYLITGGSGFIGKNLIKRLEDEALSYQNIDIRSKSKADLVFDIVTEELPKIRCDKIVHLASETNVRDSLNHPKTYIRRNTSGLLNILDYALENLISEVIFTSSASSEAALSPYLASKAACEAICKSYFSSYGLKVRILKLSGVYGPYSEHKKSVIARFIRACFNHEPLRIYGSGEQKRDFVYVGDVVESILTGKSGFIATNTATSIIQLAHIISTLSLKHLNYRPEVIFEDPVQGEVMNPVLAANISTKYSLIEGLEKTFNWYKEYYDGA